MEKNIENKIVLLTTEGCLGCSIIKRSITQAIAKAKINITFEEKDLGIVKKSFLKTNGIKDVPAVLFYKNDNLVLKAFGSKPEPVITRWIDIHFK